MKKNILLVFLILFAVNACDEPTFEKPEHLIRENQIIDMLVDVHLAEATYLNRRYSDTLVKHSTSSDFYYSVLDKYNVPDSVFEKSFVYYTGNPKNFEKMYRKVMNRLSEMEQEYSGRKNELLDVGQQQ